MGKETIFWPSLAKRYIIIKKMKNGWSGLPDWRKAEVSKLSASSKI